MNEQRTITLPPRAAWHSALRRAAERARLAPSVYNTQPWRFVITGNALEIHADEARRLRVLDPRGRQLTISCGSALFNARAAIAAAGFEPIVERLPHAYRPNLVARVSVGERRILPIAALDDEIERRHTNRRAFMGEAPPQSLVQALVAAAAEEGATLVPVTSPGQRDRLTAMCEQADAVQRADPAYVNELLAWTTTDARRTDGVQAMTIPYIPEWHDPRAGGQLRSFDASGQGWLPETTESGSNECRVVFCTTDDSRTSWLRVGEALERVWLEITRLGYWASPLNQAVEVQQTHDELREALGPGRQPQILLRVGLGPAAAPTPRRPVHEVTDDRTSYEEQS
jgi:nitroreductase